RRRGNVEVSITSVIDAALNGSVRCPALVTRLQAMQALAQEMPERQTMHEWMTFAEKLLTAVGWPGERELNRDEQASISEWHRAMDAAGQLDAVSPTCGWPNAFGRWRAILRSRRLMPPVEVNAVQLVTIEEAAYLESDSLWVAGLHDGAWPNAIEVNPLLPFSVQREYGIPGADPVREWNDADGVIDRVHTYNRETIMSYARLDGETLRRKFANLNATPIDTTPNAPWPRRGTPEEYSLVDDSYASEIQTHTAVTGGVGLFTDQAACPMRAFGRHRLKAQSPLDATPGLNAMQRGSLIHALMAKFWQRVESSARLHAATEEEIRQIFAICAEAVVKEFRVQYHLLDPYWDLERERLCELGQEWLKLELQREDFDVIACEHSRVATIGAHTINTRIDRVDRLANGEVLIFDYKTGDVPRRSWENPRPDQPQLPLYAVTTTDESVAGIAYARIKKGDCKIVDEPNRIAGDSNATADMRTQWRAQMEAWRAALEELAHEIESGLAIANPKHGTTTCLYCDLQCFCRIHEVRPDQVLELDNED
ncbi:MAG: PD-(D/E)XK nuclease family protein, partial [Gammaproteobacteria bacterium]